MAKTYPEVQELTHSTAKAVTKSAEDWMLFLDTAARMYRYSFQEQMLIHAQRPDATACASFDLWRQRFNRAVMRGRKGIALIDETTDRPRLKYVFDVSDTVRRQGGKDPNLWSIPPAPENEVVQRLADRFQTEPEYLTLDNLLHTLAVEATVDVLDETLDELAERVHDSFLEGLDGENLSTRLHFTMDTSLEYILLARCGYRPRDYFGAEDFEYITEFNTLEALTAMGNAMSELSNSILTTIGQITRQMRREYAQQNKAEQGLDKPAPDDYYTLKHKSEPDTEIEQGGQDHGADVSRGTGRAAVPGPGAEGAGGVRAGDVREAPPGVPENPETDGISAHADEGRAVAPSGGGGQESHGDGGPDREPDGGAERRDGGAESPESDGVGAPDEQSDPGGAGDRDERTGVPVREPAREPNRLENRPDGTELSGHFLPAEIVDEFLRLGGNRRNSVLRIIAHHQLQGANFPGFLREEFCDDGMRPGGRGLVLDGVKYAAWFNLDGLHLARGTTVDSPEAALFTWEQVANQIGSLLNQGLYQPQVVVDMAIGRERLECAEALWHLRHDYNTEHERPFFMDEELFRFGGYPSETEGIARRLADPDFLRQTVTGLNEFRLAYAEDKSLMRFHHHQPLFLLERMVKLLNEPLNYPVSAIQPTEHTFFITEDEVDQTIRGRDTMALALYSYFIHDHTPKEQEAFLKQTYGTSGHSHGISFADNSFLDYSAKGATFQRGEVEVRLNWTQYAKRLRELVLTGHFLTQDDIDKIPEYEREQLVRRVTTSFQFFGWDNLPDTPGDYYVKKDAISGMLATDAGINQLLAGMMRNISGMAEDNPQQERMMGIYGDLTAYRNGTFSLFIPSAALQAEAEQRGVSLFVHPGRSLAKEQMVYRLREGQTVFVSGTRYEVGELYANNMVLRDSDFPLSTFLYVWEDLEPLLRQDSRNDYLLVEPEPEQPEEVPQEKAAEVPEQIEETAQEEPEQAEEAEEPSEPPELTEAKALITAYTLAEFGAEPDFSDLSRVDLAFSTFEDGDHAAQVTANLLAACIVYEVDGATVHTLRCDTLAELNEYLANLDFAALILDAELAYEMAQGAEISEEPELTETAETEPETTEPEPVETAEPEPSAPQEPVGERAPEAQEPTEEPKPALREIVIDLTPKEPVQEPINFHITDDELGFGGPKEKFRRNLAAIQLVHRLEQERRMANPTEQAILAQYVGWGGIPQAFDPHNSQWAEEFQELHRELSPAEYNAARGSVLNAHYTSPVVIREIYAGLERMGFTDGNILEPSMGVGNFFGMLPDSLAGSKLYGVELDEITGKIAKQLYQRASIVVTGFERTSFPNDFFDVVVGNVPFGNYQVSDRQYDRHHFMIHDYFLAKSLDKLRPGGVMAVITSSGTLDKKDDGPRRYLAERADLLGAVRLPQNTFEKNAGTSVVTDILFLQKRETLRAQMPEWVSVGMNAAGFSCNRYFISHPDMVLGEWTEENTQYGRMEATIKPFEDADLGALLREAIGKIEGRIELSLQEDEELSEEPETIPADPDVRNFSYTVVEGDVYYRENSVMRKLALSDNAAQRVRGMVAIRDCARELIDAQLEDASDEEITRLQSTLNGYYDRFTKKFGLISSQSNRRAFANDNSYCLLRSLEVLDNEGNLVRKADMFTKRTIKRSKTVDHVDTASEALAVSIADKAAVDLDYMAQLTGSNVEDVAKELRGVIFFDPTLQKWQTADEYLSGNVRVKLRTAEMVAQSNGDFQPNVDALRRVQPKDLTASEISVRLGAAWVSPEYIQQFLFELLHTPFYLQGRAIQVHYSKVSGTWSISGKNADSYRNVYANKVYGTDAVNGYRLLEDCLNLRDTRILRKVYINGDEKTEVDPKATMLAQQKQDAIREQFKDWIFRDPKRRAALVQEYNERFNSVRPRQYNGSHIRFDGMNPEISLREHQLNAVAHVLYGPNTLLAHCVGAGKTYEMAAAAMESKRLGLCQKSLFVVPNHLVEKRCSLRVLGCLSSSMWHKSRTIWTQNRLKNPSSVGSTQRVFLVYYPADVDHESSNSQENSSFTLSLESSYESSVITTYWMAIPSM